MNELEDFAARYGRHLEIVLERRNMTPAQLARRVGASPRSVERWLTGRALPHLTTAMRVFVALGRPTELNLASLVPG